MECQNCSGKGHIHSTELFRGRRVDIGLHCHSCEGTGQVGAAAAVDETYADRLEAALDALMVEQMAEMDAEAEMAASFTVAGKVVHAPGFTADQLAAFVARAREAQLRTAPAGTPGTVMVQSGSSSASYAVTRSSCSCRGHQSVGRCYHRGLCIWLADVQDVNVCRIPTIGFSKRGIPLTIGRKPAAAPALAAAQLQEAA